ncbi:hypothetical protein A2125_02070 [Candidatus Woesebacteria bacterium GWB1_43_5]|uniref:Uncharacterized protein n=1 Tax=Candidatus Woesebacteria bacterium GWB1_43_5 TaxID=1802474 RepID=A0A1F7WRG9_9BACT|nr:MAG: hypothetical protein A2125_02070 [Candidatus Woesebacteria bacterium GWB1_43_5]
MAVYLTAIQTRLQQTPGGEGNEKTDILSNLAGDVVWWRQYKNVYSQDNDAQEVLLTKSDEGKRHYEETSNRFIYETLSTISFSKFRDTKTNLENIYRQINPKTLGADGARRALFDRWVADIEAEFQKVTDIESEIGEIRKEFDAKSKPSDVYLKLIAKVSEGKDSFLAIIGFLSELLAATNLNNGQ